MKYKFYFIMLLVLFSVPALAQNVISGKVTDHISNEPLPGVNVRVKGSGGGTVTSVTGEFKIAADSQDTLVFSFVGYLTKEIIPGNRSTINVTLTEDLKTLSEVVVVGYGTQKKSDITGAVSTVSTKEITETPVLRLEQALQGRVAGVQVTNQSGQPGDAPTIRIRGAGTTGNADPLYIVDGMPVGGIDFLNPGDIESINVLKDAASAAIYGSRAANGVVLITTKTGKKKEGTLSYETYYGIQNPWKKMAVLNATEYAIMMNEGAANAGLTPKYADPRSLGEGTDWQDALFNENAPISNHQLIFSGGGGKSNFATSLSYFSQEGIVGGDKSKFDRYTARINSNHEIGSRLNFGNNIAYTHISRNAIEANQEFGGVLNNALNLDPLTPVIVTDPDVAATYNKQAVKDANGNYYGISSNVAQEVVNPLARLAVTNGGTKVDKVVGNVYGELDIIENLQFRSSFGVDLAFVTVDNFQPVFYLNPAQTNTKSLVSKESNRYFTWQWENTINYEKRFNDHQVGVLIGTTALEHDFENVFASKSGLVTGNPGNAFLNLATDEESAKATGGASEFALLSYFGRVNYSYKDKYLLTGVVRRDGSSRFGPENRFATFPAVSAGWIVSREDFFKVPLINYAKVRASWGQNGNQEIGNYPWTSTIGVGRGYTFIGPNGEVFISGAVPTKIPNPNLKWETSEQTDIGLDLGFFSDKLVLNLDYYIKTTKGLLVDAPIPGIVGNEPPTVNGGEVRNQGLEVALSYLNSINDLHYNVGLNFTTNHNEVTKIENAEGVIVGASFATYGTVSRAEVGQPIGYFWGYKTNGIFQTQEEVEAYRGAEGKVLQPLAKAGDVRFVDYNGDGVINDKDRTFIGNPTPKITYGFNLNADYKGFDVSMFFQGAYGNEIFNGTKRHDLVTSNMPAYYLERWTGEGTSNTLPRFTFNDANGNYGRISDLYIEDGSYLRLKVLQFGYNLPTDLLKIVKMSKARVYVSADNLLTFTNHRGFDPEVGARSSLDIGIDRGMYPQARTYRLGVNVSF